MNNCCPSKQQKKTDWLLLISTSIVAISFVSYWFQSASTSKFFIISATTVEMLDAMWIGMALGVFIVGWLGRLPREIILATIGEGHTVNGLIRATFAGLLFDLCNHGILMVGMKLYERGASLGQVMAFIIASPWNSFTLTFILFGLIGWQLTLLFILLSLVVAWISGYIFDRLEQKGTLPKNPNSQSFDEDFKIMPALKQLLKQADYSPNATFSMFINGLKDSQMIFRWVMVGIVLIAMIRAFVPPESFSQWYGATTSGLLLTLLAATIIEVCSEGSTPIAADLITRANAPGNAFTFLMAGASTDYTEVMVLKDTTKSWKIALFLPLITVPQILLIGWLININ
ncbi:ATPase [Thalassotalea sp. M1531]|uniref:ATPase n=1 Tax=Thalassotalea algicola TaxID=2716224 RepID=A0A7Y0LG00_9GAMM|nr:permease [Thalassotalea algicola]NMP33569.1 ATPase [Thalassotalea algicola]